MGQIAGKYDFLSRVNLKDLSTIPTPAAGEHILVSSDNSMNEAGQGNFDAYVVGDGHTAAKNLPLKRCEGAMDMLLTDVDGMEVATNLNGSYIRFSDGASVGSGSWFDEYKIPNDGYSKITARLACTDNVPAAIAFYSTDAVSTSGYMASASVQHKNTGSGGSIFIANVPDGCKLIVCTNRNTSLANPTITLEKNKLVEINAKIAEQEQEIAKINDGLTSEFDGIELADKTDGYYIKWADGAKTGSGTWFDIYSIPNKGYLKVSAKLACADSNSAAIAFYNTDTISTAGFMQSASVQHRNTGNAGAVFEADVPSGCKLIVCINRDGMLANPTITIIGNLPKSNEERINEIEAKIGDPTADYAEELLTTLEINSSSANWYADSDTFNFKAGDVVKIAVEKTAPYSSAHIEFRALPELGEYASLLDGDVRFFSIPYAISTKIRLIHTGKTGTIVRIYKVTRPDLMATHPEIFGNVENTRMMLGNNKGNASIEWLDNKGSYQYTSQRTTNNDAYYYIRKGASPQKIGTKLFYAVNPKVRVTLANTDYKYSFYVVKDLDRMTFYDTGWLTATSYEKQFYGLAFTLNLQRVDGANIGDNAVTDSGISIEILNEYQEPLASFQKVMQLEEEVASIDVSGLERTRTKANDAISRQFLAKPFYHHIFIDTVGDQNLRPAIPCQSLYDVDAAARLGMDYLELNIHLTSDGVPIAIHGQYFDGAACLGYEVTDVSGNFTDAVCKTPISQLTYQWIADNVRYKSKYPKHRTTIVPLEEILKECKKRGISVMMIFNSTSYALAKKYFGDRFIAYGGLREGGFTGVVMHYTGASTEDAVLAECDAVTPPYIHMMTNDAFNTFKTAGTLGDIIQKIHERGCLAGIAGCYHPASEILEFFSLGGDVSASEEFVNDFATGNICNLKGDDTFGDFAVTGGSVADGVLTLQSGGTIGTSISESVYLGKGSLHIRFNGTLKMTSFGHSKFTNLTLESDGESVTWLSTYFLEQVPTFSLQATASTQVFMIDYKASKV